MMVLTFHLTEELCGMLGVVMQDSLGVVLSQKEKNKKAWIGSPFSFRKG